MKKCILIGFLAFTAAAHCSDATVVSLNAFTGPLFHGQQQSFYDALYPAFWSNNGERFATLLESSGEHKEAIVTELLKAPIQWESCTFSNLTSATIVEGYTKTGILQLLLRYAKGDDILDVFDSAKEYGFVMYSDAFELLLVRLQALQEEKNQSLKDTTGQTIKKHLQEVATYQKTYYDDEESKEVTTILTTNQQFRPIVEDPSDSSALNQS